MFAEDIKLRLDVGDDLKQVAKCYRAVLFATSPTIGWKTALTTVNDGTLKLCLCSLDDNAWLEPTGPAYGLWIREPETEEPSSLSCIRRLPYNTATSSSLALARSWLQACVSEDCAAYIKGRHLEVSRHSGIMPGRLIEITGLDRGTLKLIATANLRSDYAALSYKWGGGDAKWKTVRSNSSSRGYGFRFEELPQTLMDAVAITAALGLHYVWIDAICIIQDSERDWEIEASKMSHIYQGAIVTIAAHSSTSSTSGIFNERSQSRFDGWEPYRKLHGWVRGTECTIYLAHDGPDSQWRYSVERGSLHERAWCLQESLLSPRILHFTDTQLFWECPHRMQSEDNYNDQDSTADLDISGLYLPGKGWALKSWLQQDSPPVNATYSIEDRTLSMWYFAVISKDYSTRQLMIASDRLIAVAGVAKAMQKLCDMQYYAGLWSHKMVQGLCWYRLGSLQGTKSQHAPSWSWASQDSRVDWMNKNLFDGIKGLTIDVVEVAKILEINIETSGEDKEFGPIKHASVKIRTLACEGQCLLEKRSPSITRPPHLMKDRQYIQLRSDQGLQQDISTWTWMRMDSDSDELRQVDVTVCMMLGPPYCFLLLVPDGAGNGIWRRIGWAYETGGEVAEEDVFDFFRPDNVQEFTIV